MDVFTRNEYRDMLVESLKHCQAKKGLEIYAWVIMTNHIHLIAGSRRNAIEEIIRDFKKYTSVQLCRAIESSSTESRKDWLMYFVRQSAKQSSKHIKNKFWQDGFHPIELSDNEMIEQRLNYIHENPVKAGWVFQPQDYIYSSAGVYAGLPDQKIEVCLIE